jgi:uncharacterized membrane protein
MTDRWEDHPGVSSGDQLTLGQRAADKMRNGMGSWFFVAAALLFLAVWMGFNRSDGFDPFPFILLNLVLSCLAAMQGAILLIAAKRSDEQAAELAQHDLDINQESLQTLQRLEREALRRLDRIEKAMGIVEPVQDGSPQMF